MYHPVFGGSTWLLKITRLISNRPMQHNCYVGSHNRQAQALLKPAGKSRRHKLDRSPLRVIQRRLRRRKGVPKRASD